MQLIEAVEFLGWNEPEKKIVICSQINKKVQTKFMLSRQTIYGLIKGQVHE